MTFIISSEGVKNTKGTEVRMGKAQIKVGGDLVNESKMSLYETDLEVKKDFIQRGDFRVNDPQRFAQAVIELTKSTKDVAIFGGKVLDLLRH